MKGETAAWLAAVSPLCCFGEQHLGAEVRKSGAGVRKIGNLRSQCDQRGRKEPHVQPSMPAEPPAVVTVQRCDAG